MDTARVCYLALAESNTHSPFHLLSNISYFGLISGTLMVTCGIERTLSASPMSSKKSCVHEFKHKTSTDFNGALRLFSCVSYHDTQTLGITTDYYSFHELALTSLLSTEMESEM